MENLKATPITVDPAGGEILSVVGGNYRILVSGKQTNGAFSTIEMLVPPQNGPGPHSHANFYESFYIVEGEVEVHSEAGSYVVSYLLNNDQPDLIFMDIQLADGLCFEIFKNVEVLSPVIFCTAFDEYAIKAFKSNGIDYVLKPFSRESIAQAIKKAAELKNFFQRNKKMMPDFEYLLTRNGEKTGKSSFLVFKNNKYQTILTEHIAFFFIRHEIPTIMTFNKNEYRITQSLDEVHKLLPPAQFFRITRQYLVNFTAIKEAEHYFSRKLIIKLAIPTEEKILIGKEKVTAFLSWLENR